MTDKSLESTVIDQACQITQLRHCAEEDKKTLAECVALIRRLSDFATAVRDLLPEVERPKALLNSTIALEELVETLKSYMRKRKVRNSA